MSGEPWTIERICQALGNPALSKRFLSEINRAPQDQLLDVFAHWQRAAEGVLAGVERARELAAAEEAGEELPGDWTDVTDRIRAEAEEIRQRRGAA